MSAPSPVPLRVLIIDDEKEFAETLAHRLELRNIQARAAFSGEQGLGFLSEGDLPDALLLDMRMPGLSGVDVLRRVRERFADLPVIIVSGHCSEEEHATADRLGIQGYHHKPVDFTDILGNILRVAGRGAGK